MELLGNKDFGGNGTSPGRGEKVERPLS